MKRTEKVAISEKTETVPFQSTVAQTYGEQMLDLIKRRNIPNITLPADANGHAYIDKEKHPELYDRTVNE